MTPPAIITALEDLRAHERCRAPLDPPTTLVPDEMGAAMVRKDRGAIARWKPSELLFARPRWPRNQWPCFDGAQSPEGRESAMASRLDELTSEILALRPEEQRELISRLRRRLEIPDEEWSWLRAAESAFDFWDNTQDAVYDRS